MIARRSRECSVGSGLEHDNRKEARRVERVSDHHYLCSSRSCRLSNSSTTHKPVNMAETEMAFEPTGIFDFEPLPTPPLSTSGSLGKADPSPTKDSAVSATRATANDDVEMEDLEMMAEKAERASRRFAADTPPPDIMDEEGWEAEMDAMQAMEEPDWEAEARQPVPPAATQSLRSSQAGPPRSQLSAAARAAILASMTAEPDPPSQQAEGNQAFEMEEDIFGGMETSAPVASCKSFVPG